MASPLAVGKKHLLVTNDFPPKVGGIQNYLWELWRRLPQDTAMVYTTPYKGSEQFDAKQDFKILRSPEPVLLPYPWLKKRLLSLVEEHAIELVLFDPAWPLGFLGPNLGVPYGVVLHGAEVVIPAHLPLSRRMLKKSINEASLVIANSHYPLDEAQKLVGKELPSVVVYPGVDTKRFRPMTVTERAEHRAKLGVAEDEILLSVVSRLVPRKGMKVLIEAINRIKSEIKIKVMIGGKGREEKSLRRMIERLSVPVELLGPLPDEDVVRLYGASDLMAMLCAERWFGLEQEGFGIVFLEAAACGLPQIAGRSGGAHEAVEHGHTGLIIDRTDRVAETAEAIRRLASSATLRAEMGSAARNRTLREFDYDFLAERLHQAING